ncbi:MAG: hypothetical protein K0S44_829 [Bacteroidetes bacterium]|nr:hypothetical protein [Bacteroidota bacterium]
MCGPIALAIPVDRSSVHRILLGSLIYNAGRILTYSIMGLVFGLIGQGFAIAGLQNILSVVLGVLILLFMFLPQQPFIVAKKGVVFRLLEKLKSRLRNQFNIHSKRSLFLIGTLNGLLPCGLVYLGIAGSISAGSSLNGALFMAGFGLGTFPAMMTITVIRDVITVSFREKIRRAMPVFIAFMAVLLILRGLNLGIPYISPSIETMGNTTQHTCCHK